MGIADTALLDFEAEGPKGSDRVPELYDCAAPKPEPALQRQ